MIVGVFLTLLFVFAPVLFSQADVFQYLPSVAERATASAALQAGRRFLALSSLALGFLLRPGLLICLR